MYQNDALDVVLRKKKSLEHKRSSEVTNLDLNSNFNLYESRQIIPQNEPLVQIFSKKLVREAKGVFSTLNEAREPTQSSEAKECC